MNHDFLADAVKTPVLRPDDPLLLEALAHPAPEVRRRARISQLFLEGHGATAIARIVKKDVSGTAAFLRKLQRVGFDLLFVKKGPKGTTWRTHPPKEAICQRLRSLHAQGKDISMSGITLQDPQLFNAAKTAISTSWAKVLSACGLPPLRRSTANAHRKEAYDLALELKKQGLSSQQIAQRTGVSRDVIHEWLRGRTRPREMVVYHNQNRIKPQGANLTPDLGYILGVICGDGYMSRRPRARLQLEATDVDFVIAFRDALGRQFLDRLPVVIFRRSRKGGKPCETWRLQLGSKEVVEELLRLGAPSGNKTDDWEVPPSILDSGDAKIAASFLRAFFDSEGTINKNHGQVSVSSNSVEGLEGIRMLLRRLDIESSIYDRYSASRPKAKILSVLSASGGRDRFCKRVGFSIRRKQDLLERFVKP